MPEGDTIHRIARRINAALEGRELDLADAPSPRSPIHNRAAELEGRTLERAEALGKHLLVRFSGALVIHSHLGMNGHWRIGPDAAARADGRQAVAPGERVAGAQRPRTDATRPRPTARRV